MDMYIEVLLCRNNFTVLFEIDDVMDFHGLARAAVGLIALDNGDSMIAEVHERPDLSVFILRNNSAGGANGRYYKHPRGDVLHYFPIQITPCC